MASMDKWQPSSGGVRDPRSAAKKNGMFWNFPRFLRFGGAPGAPKQSGTKGINVMAGEGQQAAAPISDRGEGPSVSDEQAAPSPEPSAEQQAKLAQTGQLFTVLAQDPKYRDRVLGLVAEANPGLYIPEVAVPTEVAKKVDERFKPVEEDAASIKKELQEIKAHLARQGWAAQTGLTTDEVVEVETLAKEAGITKAETALEHWQMKQRLGTPRATPQAKASDEYLTKIRKTSPKDTAALKRLAIEEGMRIQRETRGRRAG